MTDQIGGTNKSAKSIFETIRHPQALLGWSSQKWIPLRLPLPLEVIFNSGIASNLKSKADLQPTIAEKLIPGTSDEF